MSFCHNLWFSVVRYFPNGIFPRATSQVIIFQSGNFQMCNFPSGNFPKVRPGGNGGGRALRLGQTWKVASRENTLGKLPLGKNLLGKVHRFSNHYVFATQCSRPLIFKTMNSVRLNKLSFNYHHTIRVQR